MRGAGTHLLIAWLIAFLMAGPVSAAPALVPGPDFYAGKGGTKLLVVVAPADARAKALLGHVEQVAETVVDASDRFMAVRGIDAFDLNAASARATRQADATRLAGEAKQALDDLDSAKATKLYAEAVAAWKQADLSRGIEGLLEAQTGKAAGHSVSEENPQAKAELDKVLVLAPKTKLSDAHFPPELLKYAEGQKKALGRPKGKVTVRTEPPGARVWVDGVYRGFSPVTVEGMAPGQHLVVAGLSGQSLEVEELPPGDHLLKLKAAEQAALLQGALERMQQDPEGPARELGQAARADQVLVLITKKGSDPDKLDVTAVRIDAIDGHVYARGSGALGTTAAGAKATPDWLAAMLTNDEVRGSSASTSSKPKKGGGISALRVAGIGLLGGAVVAGASWGVFGFTALGRVSYFNAQLQIEAMKSNQAVRDGRTFALIADISWAVGAAFLIAGILLVVLGGSSSSSSRSGGARGGPGGKPPEDDAMREYRRHQEEQKRLEEERAKKAAEQPPPPAEEKKPDETKPAEEKKPEETKPAEENKPAEEKKKLTPEEEKAEKKKKAEEEKAEKKRKADEEKAEKKRKAEEEKKKTEEEKAEKKKKADEEKAKAAEEKKKAAEDKKKAAEAEKQRKADDEKKKTEDQQRQKEEEQKKADEVEARRLDEERKKKEEEQRKREDERKPPDKKPDKKDPEEDLRNF